MLQTITGVTQVTRTKSSRRSPPSWRSKEHGSTPGAVITPAALGCSHRESRRGNANSRRAAGNKADASCASSPPRLTAALGEYDSVCFEKPAVKPSNQLARAHRRRARDNRRFVDCDTTPTIAVVCEQTQRRAWQFCTRMTKHHDHAGRRSQRTLRGMGHMLTFLCAPTLVLRARARMQRESCVNRCKLRALFPREVSTWT